MIDETEARARVEQMLVKLAVESGVPLTVEIVHAHSFGWVFFYNSVEYLETGDRNAMIFGEGPLIVDRESGAIHQCGTSDPVEYYVKNYIDTGDPFVESPES